MTNFPGWWLQTDITRTIELPCAWSLDLGTSLGYATYHNTSTTLGYDPTVASYYFGRWSGFQAATFSSTLHIPLVVKNLTLNPKLAFSTPLSSHASNYLKANSWDGDDNHIVGGLNLTYTF